MNDQIRMTFRCQVSQQEMKATSRGRFCSECSKEVFDLRFKSPDQIRKIKDENPEICAIFRLEQVDTHLVPIELTILPGIKKGLIAAGIFAGLNFQQGYGQTSSVPAQSEITDKRSSSPIQDTSKIASAVEVEKQESDCKAEVKPIRKNYMKWYFSRRFPFLHRTRYLVTGRFR
jgi:hypothetical protein